MLKIRRILIVDICKCGSKQLIGNEKRSFSVRSENLFVFKILEQAVILPFKLKGIRKGWKLPD